ncbi:MAG: rane protein [Candidatus Taylorbacteria bacterium]|nr:rane protein [Candidatus Taylorbacteria bacterium]
MYIILAAIVVVLIWIVHSYNSLVSRRNRAKESWADIDVQLKRRYDLIPNLINAVKGYAAHESEAFEKVTQARAAAMGAGTLAEKGQAEAGLSGTLKSIFAIAEAYPELKANQNFLALQSELTETEDKIQASRRFYNSSVRDLNTATQSFPGNIVSGVFNFASMEFYQLNAADSAAAQPVGVKF